MTMYKNQDFFQEPCTTKSNIFSMFTELLNIKKNITNILYSIICGLLTRYSNYLDNMDYLI